MANFKTSKNILHSKTEYSRYFSAFRGVDFSSDHTEVNDSRFAYAVNMYKDYRSGQGDAVETIPGFRRVLDSLGGKFYGIHVGLGRLIVHAGKNLYCVGKIDKNGEIVMLEATELQLNVIPVIIDGSEKYEYLNESNSISFISNGSLYLLDGTNYLRIFKAYYKDGNITEINSSADENVPESSIYLFSARVRDEAYIPTTHIAIDPAAQYDSVAEDYGKGREHEQKNILQRLYKHTFLADGNVKEFMMKYGILLPASSNYSYYDFSTADNIIFPPEWLGVSVKQYGVLLPWSILVDGEARAPSKYPNAVKNIHSDGRIELVNAPPAPDKNNWNPTTKTFDSIDDKYNFPYAFSKGTAGIEITASRPVESISGIKPVGDAASIIEKCTIATVFDNRIFLSGNPEYPKHIFWSGIVKETGRPDPTYFGILNYDQEGVGDAPVVAMLPVADTLMVLKRDAEGEGSVLFHTASSTGEDVYSRIYPSTQGLYGVGCLGPCINFRDDPIFLSKYGVEAMGQLSVRYERAIEHRSSLIDAKLINCDLRNASIAEWEGYLLVLTEGRIFMADSRQMFTHESGVNQYEWYYLDDIGVYDGQFDEYVYATLPVDITSEEILALTSGVEIHEASRVRGYDGTEEDLIGLTANSTEGDVKSLVTSEGKTAYYRELPERDERGSLTGNTLKYYVEKSGAKTGGTFDPAVMLKVVGGDIFFATEGGALCKFNFDKRDKETGIIPNEYYDFNGRRIFSGIATKMDNCGIPHLTKNTVKRSTVIKTRTFKNSSFKVKVRTNKKTFHQVGRIINGRAVLEDTDFSSFTFSTEDKSLFSINEKEKKWVEKQHFIYSDEFRRPFAIHYLAYRYNVAGQYKE